MEWHRDRTVVEFEYRVLLPRGTMVARSEEEAQALAQPYVDDFEHVEIQRRRIEWEIADDL